MFRFTLAANITIDISVRSPDVLKTEIALSRNVIKSKLSNDPAMVRVVSTTG